MTKHISLKCNEMNESTSDLMVDSNPVTHHLTFYIGKVYVHFTILSNGEEELREETGMS